MTMASIRNELREYGLSPKKRLGQHFLVDRNIIVKVIRAAGVNKEDVILEVGPGLGEMTLELARQAKSVIAVEIDSRLAAILKKKMSVVSNVEIIQKDILRIDFDGLSHHVKAPLKVVSNLPYQISTPLLFRFIESRKLFSSLTLMLQREVVERMVAPPGGKEYGALSVLIQMVSRPSVQFFVKPSAFHPPPKVESAVVRIVWRDDLMMKAEDEDWFKEVVKASFSHRRKTLINSLKYSGLPLPPLPEKRMGATGIDPQRRSETLTVQEFIRLADALK
ncbi:MAG: ribosomal RNA small subunit methyltransferase A [Deltaproteobacteria bacterium]|nr:ribosomal RNA small subunit methyltransferase A [Deltaproteobacteria bacterium]